VPKRALKKTVLRKVQSLIKSKEALVVLALNRIRCAWNLPNAEGYDHPAEDVETKGCVEVSLRVGALDVEAAGD